MKAPCLLLVTSLAWPVHVLAAPPETDESRNPAPGNASEADPAQPADADPEPAPGPESPQPGPEQPAESPQPAVEPEVVVEQPDRPMGGGVAGSVVSADDEAANRAKSDLEGDSLDDDVEGVPERMPALQAAGWWAAFGTVAFGTAGGLFIGLAEREEDEASRLAQSLDLSTGRREEYANVSDDYEQAIGRGQLYQNVAIGMFVVSGVALITSVTLFAVHGTRKRKAKADKPRISGIGLGSVEVTF